VQLALAASKTASSPLAGIAPAVYPDEKGVELQLTEFPQLVPVFLK
jgi:hypothetical protein